ncbi:HDOD domain-containing protein [Propionivibrio sp.]|uniref:HDOD domain-containing protein n=1 Tax=Propionivibrio sp. TaxID=2212460 RepID=UPI0026301511|nr:HDOD domain-containing protein [Propionivibrio sp.]
MDGEHQSTIARLLKIMDSSPGFAGLGASVQTISSLGDDLDGGTRKITATILRDAALTSKLLRISNSSRNARGGRNVSTIDQALMVLGLNTVKSVALSLALLGSLSHKPQSNQLHSEIVAAYFCGTLACEITRLNAPRFSAQEAQVCGLMQNLGRMMATYYLYADIERSRALQAEKNITEDEAILHVLGMSFEKIGAAIAHHWCLPDVLQNSLAPDIGKAPPRVAANAQVWHQLCSSFCRRVTDALFRLPENREKIEIAREIEFFRGALHLKDVEIRELIDKCLLETDTLLAEIAFPGNVEQARTLLRKASERVLDMLASGDRLTKDSNSIGGRTPVEVIQQVLRLIHDKYNFDHTLICLPDSSSGLIAIAGVGKNVSQVTAKFRCYGPKPDLFRAIMARKTDMFIADICQPSYVKLIPEWYHEVIGARSFVMLPLLSEEKLLGMIYADYSELRSSAPQELAEGSMLEWRNLLIQALQSGSEKLA